MFDGLMSAVLHAGVLRCKSVQVCGHIPVVHETSFINVITPIIVVTRSTEHKCQGRATKTLLSARSVFIWASLNASLQRRTGAGDVLCLTALTTAKYHEHDSCVWRLNPFDGKALRSLSSLGFSKARWEVRHFNDAEVARKPL